MYNAPEQSHEYQLGLFEKYGIELEYMIVDKETLNILPLCDKVLYKISGSCTNEVMPEGPEGPSSWSNELALHVIEFKTSSPVPSLDTLDSVFMNDVNRASSILEEMEGMLMPGAMHPWMNPELEFKIWPHGDREIYETFDSIFSCKGHGWSNLQSMHINLPFRNNDEFRKLHAAIRFLLPLITPLTASSPLKEGRYTGLADTRMDVYRNNCAVIPSLTGMIIPEPVNSIDDYHKLILSKIYKDLKPFPGSGIISEEWVNARGCIARFDRGSIEIRTADIQETPSADISCAELIIETLKALVYEEYTSIDELNSIETSALYDILMDTIKNGEKSIITDRLYLKILNMPEKRHSASDILRALFDRHITSDYPHRNNLFHILTQGSLSTRIRKGLGRNPSKDKTFSIYNELCSCLSEGRLFTP